MRGKLGPAALAAVGILAMPTVRAEQSASDTAIVLEQVVVTARRKVELSADVPIAITALTQEDVRQRNIETATDLQYFVPSLNVLGIATGPESFSIRGLGATGQATGGGVGGGQGVVAYLAEAPSTASGPGVFFDLENLQVLKGPQGTLFGRNTTGGAVLLEPVRPSDEFNGYVELAAGDYGRREIRAATTIPLLADKLSVRLAGMTFQRDGYTRDIVSGRDYNNRENGSARIGILASPFSGLENYLLAQFVHNDDHGVGNVLVAVDPSNPLSAALVPYLARQQSRGTSGVSYSFSPLQKSVTTSVVDNLRWELTPRLSIKNIVSFAHVQANGSFDGDGTPTPAADLLGADPGGWSGDLKTLTEELQLQGKAGRDFLTWQAGGYYEHVYNPGPQTYNIQFGPFLLHQSLKDSRSVSRAAYAQTTLDLGAFAQQLAGLNLTTGYRHTWDSVYQGEYLTASIPQFGLTACGTGSGPYPNCLQTGSSGSEGPSWTVGLDYHLNRQTLLYAHSSQGYKSGGFNPAVPAGNPYYTYRPERARAYELGVKSDFQLREMPVRMDFDLFNTQYSEVQRNVYALVDVNGAPAQLQLTGNAAAATIRGAELETTFIPFTALQLQLTYSYTDAYYSRYITPAGQDFTGHPFEFAPRHKLSLDQQYRLLHTQSGDLTLHGTVSYQSKVAVADDREPFDTISGYTLVNLRLDWRDLVKSSWSNWDVAVFVTNLTDRTYRIYTNPTYFSSGLVTTVYGEPRMWGASIRCRF